MASVRKRKWSYKGTPREAFIVEYYLDGERVQDSTHATKALAMVRKRELERARNSGATGPRAQDLLYGAPAIAEYLGISERQARHRCETGDFPSFKMGDTVCARKSSLDAAIDRMEQESSKEKFNGKREKAK